MGWREEEEKANQMKAANDARQDKLNNFDMGFGSSGGKLPRFIREMPDMGPKFPDDKFDSDFLRAIDASCNVGIDITRVAELIEIFGKKGISTTRFMGVSKEGVQGHLGRVLAKYRPEIFEPIKEGFEKKGGGKK